MLGCVVCGRVEASLVQVFGHEGDTSKFCMDCVGAPVTLGYTSIPEPHLNILSADYLSVK